VRFLIHTYRGQGAYLFGMSLERWPKAVSSLYKAFVSSLRFFNFFRFSLLMFYSNELLSIPNIVLRFGTAHMPAPD
jgi:hypothetical protein